MERCRTPATGTPGARDGHLFVLTDEAPGMGLEIRGVEIAVRDAALRMPFHFANTTVTDLPHVFLAVDLSVGAGEGTERGVAAEGFSPVWFLKDEVPFDEGIEWMFDVVDHACEVGRATEAETVFDFWRRLFAEQRDWGEEASYPPLLWSFGASMVERAVIDAYCRATDTTFADAVRENALGIELGTVYDELEGADHADLLPDEPQSSIPVRHTVGFTDPLTEVAPGDRLDDGLPQSLAEYVDAQGLASFKIKLTGDAERDAERLADIADVLDARCPDDYAFTLDANEQYGTAAEFRRQWEQLATDPALSSFLERLRYVEQPLARDEALGEETAAVLTDWADGPPVIIDESDAYLDSFGRALDCGYRGTSHKNCKGVFRGLLNACLAEHRRRKDPDGEYVVSAEDLTVTGPVALQQDLAVVATIGADDVERNGHHYFRGLSAFPEATQSAVLDAHGDLFRRHEDGFVTVDVSDGALALDSVVDAPFGHDVPIDLDRFTPRAEWSIES